MRRSFSFVSALGLGLGSLVGCGGAGAVNFYDGDSGSAGRNASAAGAPNVAGGQSVAGAASAGAPTIASAGSPGDAGASTSGPHDAPCTPAMDVTDNGNMMSGEFKTEGPVCLLVKDDIIGWGCSNFEGRTLKVNGVEVSCAELPLPDKLHGSYYFDVSAGAHAYASLYWY
jgi:endoglucanase